MKTLTINTVCGTGSTGRIATDIYREFVQIPGNQGLVAYGRGSAPDDVNAYRIGTNYDVMWHGVFTRITDKHGMASQHATLQMLRYVEQFDPDIIHMHNIHGYYINIPRLFLYLSRHSIPIIWTLHDCWPLTGHCAHFDYSGCSKWMSSCSHCPEKGQYPASYIFDNSAVNYRLKKQLFNSVKNMVLVTPSKWLADIISKSFLVNYPIRVIPNGIDLNIFRPTPSGFKSNNGLNGKTILLGVANKWTPRKGIDTFNWLAENLSSHYKIILVGHRPGNQNIHEKILHVPYCGSAREMAEIYSATDIFVNPTLEDTFPTTNLEALACGTPILSFDTGGSPECFDNTCGVTVKKGDASSMMEAINSGRLKNMRDLCIKKSQSFDKRTMLNQYIELYSHMKQNKQP